MNAWQIAMEIRATLRSMRWGEGDQELVFGPESVFVTAGPPTEEMLPGGFPFAIIQIGNGTNDPDNPGIEDRSFSLGLVQMQEGDWMGEQAIIGGPRAGSAIGTSRGRGVLEIASLVRDRLRKLTGWDGIPITWVNTGTPNTAPLDGGGVHLASVSPSFRVRCTTALRYPAIYNVEVSGDTVTWEAARATEGLIEYVVVSGAGPAPPESPSDGTVIGRTTGTSLTDAAVGAAAVVAVFAGYSLVGGAESQVYTPTEVGSWR